MSGAITTAVVTGIAGAVVSKVLAPEPPEIPEPAAPTAPPQASRAPDERARRAAAAGRGSAAGTLLTGAGGVAPDALSLGKNALLGKNTLLGQ